MIVKEDDIVFVTNSLYTKWMDYQSKIIKRLFPNSDHIIVDWSTPEFKANWPNSWFYHLDEIKKSDKKYYIHIDEDFFLTSKEELLKAVQKMEDENIDLLGCPDGYQHFRGANPVAINTFFMIGRVEDVKRLDVDLKSAKYSIVVSEGNIYHWSNNFGIKFEEIFKDDFNYRWEDQGGSNFKYDHEPYYTFLWSMKEMGCKFDYLYPFFDDRFKSTNPRLEKDSDDIGIHMWYTRNCDSNMDVWGLPNVERYNLVEKYINELYEI